MMFTLPLLPDKRVENLQLFIKSRKEGQKLDWENCSLYFLLETPKMGEIGISLTANERNLSVVLKK